jgi:tRNA pseudouridine13 synthase
MYKLKQSPEDFIVEEQIQLELDDGGQYAYFWLRKRGYTTQRALQKITGFLKKRLRDAGFAGNKDKQAVTKQAISIKDPENRLGGKSFGAFNSDDLRLEYMGRGKKPISLGDLDGNRFDIVVRECDREPKGISQSVNYFDEQRFSKTNVDVGRAILKGDFRKACSLIDAKDVAEHLKENPNDFVGAMKRLPLKTRLLHVHAYQSWLWNEAVSQYLQCKYKVLKCQYSLGELCFPQEEVADKSVPIVGFGTELAADEIGKIIKQIMEKEGVTQRDFVIKSMPELTAEGGKRELDVEVKDLAIEKAGEKEYKIRFLLQKGSYATMAVKQMMA